MRAIELVTALCFVAFLAAAAPNIVVIVGDDLGLSDIGCYGGEIETPHLDGLASSGLRYRNFYVNNMCWPTRASLMTSLYPKTALHEGRSNSGLHIDAVTLPEKLKEAGYATFMVGKWHLADSAHPNGPHAPHKRGFDRFYGTIEGASDFFAPADLQLNGKSMTHEWDNNPDYYYSDALTDYALKFIQTRDRQQPFFLYMAFTAAHWPLHAKPADIARYKGRYGKGWDEMRQARFAKMKQLGVIDGRYKLSPRHSRVPAWKDEKHTAWQERRMEVYAAQLTNLDWNIGRVIEQLRSEGTLDDTLILYQHDNGACHVEYSQTRTGSWTRAKTTDGKNRPIRPGNVPDLMPGDQTTFQSYGYGWANMSATPYRLFKKYDHEGGTKSPLIIHWPKGINRGLRGTFVDDLCHVVDIMPTLLEVAGVEEWQQRPLPAEGRSFSSNFSGKTAPEHDALYWEHRQGKAVRSGNWKLVAEGKNSWELYNLAKDPVELNDLAGRMPEKVTALSAMHRQWSRRTDLARTGNQ